jgi:hypothetical protein
MESILGNSRKSDISFYANGEISISAHLAKSLSLANGDVIDLMKDNDEIYIYVKHRCPEYGKHQARVYRTNAKGNHFRCSSIKLCRFILAECNATDSVYLPIGSAINLTPYGIAFPIITKNIIKL